MALKAQVEKLEVVPQEDQKHYQKIDGTDGKFVYRLHVDPSDGYELTNPTGLKSTVEALRQFEDRSKKFGNVTPEEVAANAKLVLDLKAENESLKTSGKGQGDERLKQVTEELTSRHKEALDAEVSRSRARLAEVVRLRKDEAAMAAVVAAGFGDSRDLIAPRLADELDVVEDEKAADERSRFRTVVRGEKGVEKIYVDKTGAHRPMSAAERAQEMAQDAKYKRYVDVKLPPAATESSRPGGYQPALKPTQPSDAANQNGQGGAARFVANPLAQPIQNLSAALKTSKPGQTQ